MKFVSLTPAQKLWLLINIHKDKEEEAEKLLKVFQHLRPEVYFSKQVSDAQSTDFLENIQAQLGRELSPEEKIELGITVEEEYSDEDVDIIERA